MTDEKFISGEWYEREYATPGSRYWDQQVAPFPEWAKAANRHHAGVVAAWLDLTDGVDGAVGHTDTVVDLGSGLGHYVEAWTSLGFATIGIEISQSAVLRAVKLYPQRTIICGSVDDVLRQRYYHGEKFTLAFSADFMEHVSRSITPTVVRAIHKVARYAAHYIPLEQGDDPSHIHVQSAEAWCVELASILGDGYIAISVPNLVDPSHPLFFTMKREDMPWPIAAYVLGGVEAARRSLERQANG